MPKIFLLTLIALGFFAVDEAKAMSCFIYCPPGMQQQIIGYQAYPYYTPRLTYDLNYGYYPIYGSGGYGGGYGGYNPYGGGYGPHFGNGYGNSGYNPNWYNQGFPFSYPRGMVNLRPRSGSPGIGYTSIASRAPTPRNPQPAPAPSVVPAPVNPPAPPPVEVPEPVTPVAPAPPPVSVAPAPAPAPQPKPPVEELVTDCSQFVRTSTRRTLKHGSASDEACDKRAQALEDKGHIVKINYTRTESSWCTIKYIKKEDYEKCNPMPPARPQVPRPAVEIGVPTPQLELGPIEEMTPTLPTLQRPIAPVGCEDGYVQVGKDPDNCVACNKPGNVIVDGRCECGPNYSITINDGSVTCTPVDATEGDVPPCTGPNCSDAKLPETNPTKCQYTVGGKVLQFDCACVGNNKIYPSPAFFKPTSAKPYDSKFEAELNADATLALCMHENMRTGLGSNSHLNCTKAAEAGTRGGSGYCFTPEYYTDTFKAFKEAAECFGLTPKEKDQMFAKMAIESKFHLDAVNPGDPSVGVGQIHYGIDDDGRSFTAKEIKETDRYDSYLSDAKCLTKFHSLRQLMSEFSTKNSADNHLCSAVQSPEQGMFLAMAVFKSKKATVDRALEKNCKGLGKKAKDAFTTVDDTLKARLVSLAYNMGEGNLEGVLCSYAQAVLSETGTESGRSWTLNFDRAKVRDGGVELDADTSIRPTKGFWGLVQTYYNDRASQEYKRKCMATGKSAEECSQMNYVYAMNNRSLATSQRAGVQCPRP